MGLTPLSGCPGRFQIKAAKPLLIEPPSPLPDRWPVAHHSADDGFNLVVPRRVELLFRE